MEKNTPIKSFRDLRIYQNLYKAMILVLTKVIPSLPKEEKFDLSDQMSRCCKAAPALLSEGFAKRFQKINWQKYLNDTTGEANEMIHHLSVCIDVYYKYVDVGLCKELINIYDISCRQLANLKKSWTSYHERNTVH